MSSGGARNRSGPPPEVDSGRSDARGLVFTALPVDGHKGDIPEFPLPDMAVREREVWEQAWRTPQAAAWAVQAWRWRTVAMWVRWSVRMEDAEASASLGNVVVRLADQIGLTPAGLRENGWKIAEATPAARAAAAKTPARSGQKSARDRLKVLSGGSDG